MRKREGQVRAHPLMRWAEGGGIGVSSGRAAKPQGLRGPQAGGGGGGEGVMRGGNLVRQIHRKHV